MFSFISRIINDPAPGSDLTREQVKVIDYDLGESGASANERQGFQSLVTESGLGRVW